MKTQIYFTTLIFLFTVYQGNTSAQDIIEDVVSMGPGNIDMVFYSLENGASASIDQTSWDISFDTFSLQSATIRINGAQGCQLFLLGGLETWNDAATVNIEELEVLYNDPTDWGLGAYSSNGDGMFDMGWGVYDVVTHIVTGENVFILQLPSGELKKTKIVSLANDIYIYVQANLDGTDETEVLVDKTNYVNKNSVYYNFQNDEILDLEPDLGDWDFVFCKYIQDLGGDFYYPVTGCLINRTCSSQLMEGLNFPFIDETFSSELMSETTNSVGHDWKSYDQNAGLYEIMDDRCYFATTANEAVWRVVFTSYGGSATGEIGMGIILEQASVISVNDFSASESDVKVNIYPNPVSVNGKVSIDVNFSDSYSATLYNSLGAVVSQVNETTEANNGGSIVLNLSGLQAGQYVVEINNSTSRIRKQLIVQ